MAICAGDRLFVTGWLEQGANLIIVRPDRAAATRSQSR